MYHRKYSDLSLDQKISLKGEFQTNPALVNYKAVMLLFGFISAVDYFLDDDIDKLKRKTYRDWEGNAKG